MTALDQIKNQKLEHIIQASENPEESLRQLSEQFSQRQSDLYEEYWSRCRFCECGAESLKECECSTDKKWRYQKRVKRKISEDLEEEFGQNIAVTLCMLRQEHGV